MKLHGPAKWVAEHGSDNKMLCNQIESQKNIEKQGCDHVINSPVESKAPLNRSPGFVWLHHEDSPARYAGCSLAVALLMGSRLVVCTVGALFEVS